MFSLLRYAVRAIISKPQFSMLIIGLDHSGKSSFLNELRRMVGVKPIVPLQPTIGQNILSFERGKLLFRFWDLGGDIKFRDAWKLYFEETDIILFVIDGADETRLKEAFDTLSVVLEHPELKYVPVCVCDNKQDLDGALTPSDLKQLMYQDTELRKNMTTDRTSHIFPTRAPDVETVSATSALDAIAGDERSSKLALKAAAAERAKRNGVQTVVDWLEQMCTSDPFLKRRPAYRTELKQQAIKQAAALKSKTAASTSTAAAVDHSSASAHPSPPAVSSVRAYHTDQANGDEHNNSDEEEHSDYSSNSSHSSNSSVSSIPAPTGHPATASSNGTHISTSTRRAQQTVLELKSAVNAQARPNGVTPAATLSVSR